MEAPAPIGGKAGLLIWLLRAWWRYRGRDPAPAAFVATLVGRAASATDDEEVLEPLMGALEDLQRIGRGAPRPETWLDDEEAP